MIYCVVPEALEEELFEKLTAYYADDENVTVIVDRRKSDRRNRRTPDGEAPPKVDPEIAKQREVRDRRRQRVPGDHPPLSGAD